MSKFDINAKRTAKKIAHIADGKYLFTVSSFRVWENDDEETILFINTTTEDAPGLCPSLRFNMSTEQGQAWLDDFLAEITGVQEGEELEVALPDVIGLQFMGTKTTTEEGHHNIGGVRCADGEPVEKAA